MGVSGRRSKVSTPRRPQPPSRGHRHRGAVARPGETLTLPACKRNVIDETARRAIECATAGVETMRINESASCPLRRAAWSRKPSSYPLVTQHISLSEPFYLLSQKPIMKAVAALLVALVAAVSASPVLSERADQCAGIAAACTQKVTDHSTPHLYLTPTPSTCVRLRGS